jgi:hypothetical protein
MGSLNYGVFGKPFNLQGTFRVLRMKNLPSKILYYDEVAESGFSTDSNELKALIAIAQSLQFVDFGNGLSGIYARCDGFHFCAVHEHKESAIRRPERDFIPENLDKEDIF